MRTIAVQIQTQTTPEWRLHFEYSAFSSSGFTAGNLLHGNGFGSSVVADIWVRDDVSPSEMNEVDFSQHEIISTSHQWIYGWGALK